MEDAAATANGKIRVNYTQFFFGQFNFVSVFNISLEIYSLSSFHQYIERVKKKTTGARFDKKN